MSIALELYTQAGILEDHPRVIVDDMSAADFKNPTSRRVLVNDQVYEVIEIIRDVEFESLDDPVDLVKLRRKLN